MTLRRPLIDFQENMDHGSTLDPILERKKFPLTQVENSSFDYLIYSRELVLDKSVDQNFLILLVDVTWTLDRVLCKYGPWVYPSCNLASEEKSH